jgi:hypothetical protein
LFLIKGSYLLSKERVFSEGNPLWRWCVKQRKAEVIRSSVGVLGGANAGAKVGAGIGIATGGTAIVATIPLGIIGGVIFGLVGNKIGTELDRK